MVELQIINIRLQNFNLVNCACQKQCPKGKLTTEDIISCGERGDPDCLQNFFVQIKWKRNYFDEKVSVNNFFKLEIT